MLSVIFGEPYGYLPFLTSENSRQGVASIAFSREPDVFVVLPVRATAKTHTI